MVEDFCHCTYYERRSHPTIHHAMYENYETIVQTKRMNEWTNSKELFFVRNLSFSRAFLLKINLIKSTKLTFSVASSFNDRLCKEEERESFFYIFNACVCIMNEKLNHIKFSAMKWIFVSFQVSSNGRLSKYHQIPAWSHLRLHPLRLLYAMNSLFGWHLVRRKLLLHLIEYQPNMRLIDMISIMMTII